MSTERARKTTEELLAGLVGGDLELAEKQAAGDALRADPKHRLFYEGLLLDQQALAELPASDRSAEDLGQDLASVRRLVLAEIFGETPAATEPRAGAHSVTRWLAAAALATLLAASWWVWRPRGQATVGAPQPQQVAGGAPTAVTGIRVARPTARTAGSPVRASDPPAPRPTIRESASPALVDLTDLADAPLARSGTPAAAALVVWTAAGQQDEPELIIHWLIDEVVGD